MQITLVGLHRLHRLCVVAHPNHPGWVYKVNCIACIALFGNFGVAGGRQTGQNQRALNIHATSTGRRLGSFLLAALLCVVLAQPAQATRPSFASKTAGTGIFDLAAKPHTGLFCADNPIGLTDPSGRSALADVMLSMQIRVWMFAQTMAPAINVGRVILAGATLAAFLADAEFRGAFVSTSGGPGNAAIMLCAEIRMVANSGVGLYRQVGSKRNVVTLNFNTGDAHDFRMKTTDLQRAADRGELVVVNNPSSIRDTSAQAAYRRAVRNRYVNFLKEIGMTQEQALAQAEKKFETLHADHRIDLQVSGALQDPNGTSNLRMLNGSVNTSVGRQLANEIERLGLEPGDQIHEVIVNGLPQ
jgi:hypothetical protein